MTALAGVPDLLEGPEDGSALPLVNGIGKGADLFSLAFVSPTSVPVGNSAGMSVESVRSVTATPLRSGPQLKPTRSWPTTVPARPPRALMTFCRYLIAASAFSRGTSCDWAGSVMPYTSPCQRPMRHRRPALDLLNPGGD
jgi:hypothetical protein